MTNKNLSLTDRIRTYLEKLVARMEIRNKKERELLEKMKEAEDFATYKVYAKEFFRYE